MLSSSMRPFVGSNVFVSRNLVAPELFDAVLDALKIGGAEVFLCCDPSRNGPDDFHVISSVEHEKFEDLRAKGCNLIGPQCVLSSAKERRPLPKQGFTCCLAMDGIKVIASGFDAEERGKVVKYVMSMGGILLSRMSSDVNFVVVKNVRAAKYKSAVQAKKPLVNINWLYHCWSEHRVVPQDSYRVPPFAGLVICVTRISAGERKEMEQVIIQNGGKYSADLTKSCTHLIYDGTYFFLDCWHTPEGDKYKVARKWGNICIVTRKWYDQSIVKRACLNEEDFPVSGKSASSLDAIKGHLALKNSQDKSAGNCQSVQSSFVSDSKFRYFSSSMVGNSDLDATVSQTFSSAVSNDSVFAEKAEVGIPLDPPRTDQLDACVADDSQTDEDDLYLSDCRICLVGFDAIDARKLVNLVRRGGGSRFVAYSQRLTHIVVGCPSDAEKRDIRGLAALGVIHVVKGVWLDECDRRKKEIPVTQRHIAHDILHPQDSVGASKKVSGTSISSLKQGACSTVPSGIQTAISEVSGEVPMMSDKSREGKPVTSMSSCYLPKGTKESLQKCLLPVSNDMNTSQKHQLDGCSRNPKNKKFVAVFIGMKFHFSEFFSQARRDEVVEWINEGGGEISDGQMKEHVNFIVESHGVQPPLIGSSQATYVSTHWIRSCLEDGHILDVHQHILYSPLPCQIPLPGFEHFRFCVSQYEDKDKALLHNLCFVLGAKFVLNLNHKVTHLICKFTSGQKYKYACKNGIRTARCEWIYECVKKNQIVPLEDFSPEEASAQDLEADPTQATQRVSGHKHLQMSSLGRKKSLAPINAKTNSDGEYRDCTNHSNKKPKLQENVYPRKASLQSAGSANSSPTCRNTTANKIGDTPGSKPPGGIDVADVIEDLLVQTSKIQDVDSPGETDRRKAMLSPDFPLLATNQRDSTTIEQSNNWSSRDGNDEPLVPSGDKKTGLADGFSETQTESQMVGYEEDLSLRQLIIDRVRTRSSMT
ncbi:hypothetical protein Droror1_Dr00020966 [Drosera rotundifolia]